VIAELSTIQPTDYLVVGVAACQRRNSEGKAENIFVFEPIPATALEAMAIGLRTSYLQVVALPYNAVIQAEEVTVPTALQRPDLELGENFVDRANAATRTFKAKPHLQTLALGTVCTAETTAPFRLNYADEIKRLLGVKRAVSDSDNVKQHSHTHQVL